MTGLGRVAVVIPTWNEAEAIGTVVAEVLAQGVGEVIVADGGSTDGTQARAVAAGARVMDCGRGYGRACAMGAEAASPSCDVIAFMDGDGADRADQLARICGPVLAGEREFVIASRTRGAREKGSMLWLQVVAGAVLGGLIGLLYRVRYTDLCALRAIDRLSLARLEMHDMTYGWNIEMQMKAARSGLRLLELPVPYRVRAGGTSKVAGSFRGTLHAAVKILATFVRIACSAAPANGTGEQGRRE
ncbi:MAG: glycosyltransferase [Acetobacteraceae bacterium]|nr:glycosyltransferase [Acetobacteraceae bacterium]